jgi:Fe-S cluster biogenesis protein NfuA
LHITEADVKEQVIKIIERLRPSFQEDGHDIELVDITPDNIVKVKLCGHCRGGCSGSKIILGLEIERALKKKIPHVKKVQVVSGPGCEG